MPFVENTKIYNMNKIERNIIIGSLLGDGNLALYGRSKNAYYREHGCLKQIPYRLWKAEKLKNLDFKIISTLIDKQSLIDKYYYRYENYGQAIKFIIERLLKFVIPQNKKVSLVFEGRNIKLDKKLHNDIMKIIKHGTEYVSTFYTGKVADMIFNTKRTLDNLKSYPGLELADICAHQIYNHWFWKTKNDFLFDIIETKLYKSPNYMGCGLKIFP